MKNILIAAGVVGTVAASVMMYMRNRNKTSQVMHDIADAAGDAHDAVKKHIRKSNREANIEMNNALA
ncbi:hypothetical protein [Deminuibacter soli]|uniref:Uncharacterized protein n=1 Tax=Deminuibacter soli TaxID=2291815 RepID=A0A3E1NQC3_9BACT|nr:hypothetical protein [Deminuibacter soli]RFM30125.1 hypothetical protein DXN05_03890 [Deminuibacter soli]